MNYMRAPVSRRIESLGGKADDYPALDTAIKRAWEYLTNDLNTGDVPDALKNTWADIAAGFYLSEKRAAGEYKAEAAIKSLTEGDVSISYQTGTSAAELLSDIVKKLMNPAEAMLAPFRRIRW